ncbi:hypothetical protein K3759_17475 (plasmid) [Sulfitobacter sp. W027]|uniref:group I intron-associated PD-(D/E)XK endonuclease n=1 Tax=Sulfitobacter sp. W027 TaxID=2867025 RepID=UPI0021A91D18|nr:hypothetical protein [Sulfitobacter sp. W027]UWR35252.1 hypothetical protein K3759_17475 [Sulfitobacter sp. W027]
MTHQPTLVGFEEVFHAPSSEPHHDLLQFPKLDAETLRYHGKQFGRAGELLVESVLLSLGLQSVNVAEHAPFDCVVFLTQGVLRVQVKTAIRPRANCFNFNISHGYHRSPAGVRRYSQNDYDLLALVCLSENVVKFTADRRRSQTIGVEEVEKLRRRPGASFEAALSEVGVDQMAPAPTGPMPFCY